MWDIYSLVFACKHYILEEKLGALLEFCIYLRPVVWQAEFLCARLSVRGWSGGGSLKNVWHHSAKVVKRKPHLLQWYFFNHRHECEFILMRWLKGTSSFSFFSQFFFKIYVLKSIQHVFFFCRLLLQHLVSTLCLKALVLDLASLRPSDEKHSLLWLLMVDRNHLPTLDT